MSHIKITNGIQKPYDIGQLRRDNPEVSFPKIVSPKTLERYGVHKTITAISPEHNEMTQVILRDIDATDVKGQWTYLSSVREKTAKEIAVMRDRLSSNARGLRNNLLLGTDWTAVKDSPPMSDETAAYRQSLRDITKQSGFPSEIEWPTAP
jgi:hypothetical protein